MTTKRQIETIVYKGIAAKKWSIDIDDEVLVNGIVEIITDAVNNNALSAVVSNNEVAVCGFSDKCERYIRNKCHVNCGDYTHAPTT